jgi:aminodeoxyfutalosine deaminase
MDSIRIQAKFIVVSPRQILSPGQIVVRHGRIVEFSSAAASTADLDLGDAVLLPGFVNAHTHLEFSDLVQPFPAGSSFPAWIRSVIQHRIANPCSGEQRRRTIARGASECFRSGTALIADIVTQPWEWNECIEFVTTTCDSHVVRSELDSEFRSTISETAWLEHFGIVATPTLFPFVEMLGLTSERLAESILWVRRNLNLSSQVPHASMVELGISPHSPYSTLYPDILAGCASFAKQIPFAMHVAESSEELEWAATGAGPFQNAFEMLGIPVPKQRLQISEAIALLAERERSLLVHGNYLNDCEMDRVAQSGNISVVYCPRTHEHFGHTAYPLDKLMQRGIRVVLGTDSRASNPDLNIWSELQSAMRKHPTLAPQDALAAITCQAAKALGLEQDFGSLGIGRRAHINIARSTVALKLPILIEQLTSESVEFLPLTEVWCGRHTRSPECSHQQF